MAAARAVAKEDGMGWMDGWQDAKMEEKRPDTAKSQKKKAQARTKARHEEPAGLGLVLESGLTDGDGD